LFVPVSWWLPRSTDPTAEETEGGWFRDVTRRSGIDFTYRNGEEAGNYSLLESVGGGVALLDYDGDGLLDIFLTGGGYFGGPGGGSIGGYPNRLYRNLGDWKFQDVTEEVGLDKVLFYSHGAAVADYDRDGFPDLLITGWGGVALFHNVKDEEAPGGRRFVEVTKEAGLDNGITWATGAAWADLDGDGYPDLYICQYVNWSLQNNPMCGTLQRTPVAGGTLFRPTQEICSANRFNALPHKLYHNNGDGTFSDVSQQAGVNNKHSLEHGKGMGVIIADVNDDGHPDIYVADDGMGTKNSSGAKLLYFNQGSMKFKEAAEQAGAAYDDSGAPNGSKGLAAADYDGSGRLSLFVTNYEHEPHGLYRNRGDSQFIYSSRAAGIATIGLRYVGFGTGFIDFDLDGAEDLFITNGHVLRHPTEPEWILQPAVLMRNLYEPGDKPYEVRFEDVSAKAGPFFLTRHRGRGCAFGDLDNDGRVDIVISHLNEPVVVLRNEAGEGNHWLGVELAPSNHRNLVGTKLIVKAGGRTLTRFVTGGGSYLSSSDQRRIFGLGKTEKIDELTVIWPLDPRTGVRRTQRWTNLSADCYYRIIGETAIPLR
jgi:hypothetical protein